MEQFNSKLAKGLALKGKRIIITAEELELKEHRGIAVYTKSLINSLKEEGAEVWLLTQFYPRIWERGMSWLPNKTRELIFTARVLDYLSYGPRSPKLSSLASKILLIKWLYNTQEKIRKIFDLFLTSSFISKKQLFQINLNYQFDNLYLKKERLNYLQNVDGIICAKNIFKKSLFLSMLKKSKPIKIDLNGFDSLFISSPQNIISINTNRTIQTIHDLIPLEEGHVYSDHAVSFTRRLEACSKTNRIFVSRSTSKKYKNYINNQSKEFEIFDEEIIVQPPSLKVPDWIRREGDNSSDIKPRFRLLTMNKKLEPFKYFLFNSSVDPRKNLLFLVKSYSESNLFNQGIKLCITGQLKEDFYSNQVRKIVNSQPGILLTGYVSENEKLDLYLNAIGLLSPSLVEGFGIPVLDAACLGMNALVSDCDSHIEIQNIDDFKEFIHIAQTLDSIDWALAIQAIAFKQKNLYQHAEQERVRRLTRYQKKSRQIKNNFKMQINKLLIPKKAN